MKTFLEPIIAFGVVVGLVVGATSYFATAERLQLVEMRLDQKIVDDRVASKKQRMWQLEDRHKGKPDCSTWSSEEDKKEYRELKEEIKKEELRLQKMMEKK